MDIKKILSEEIHSALKSLYSEVPAQLTIEKTNKDFKGDYTLVVFPLTKVTRKKPEETAAEIGEKLKADSPIIQDFNVVKGFLNLVLKDSIWFDSFTQKPEFPPVSGKTKVIEYSSPNTNKPLHLGHLRNNLLGFAISRILEKTGNKVVKVNLVNDRGIHICKSMLAWQKLGNGETPESSGMKGDHLVGKYYVEFDKAFKSEVKQLKESGLTEEQAEKQSGLMKEAQEMLRKWEAGDKEVVDLWKRMNGWVYQGFDETYKKIGVSFDKIYYESETYLLGKSVVEDGLKKGVFFKKEDNSVWIDLTADGLDQKLLLRGDGTSVYITQDIGTAIKRVEEYDPDVLIHVVGSEQEYHFKVLKLILKKLGFAWADGIYHLSYAFVDLPEGKMKSREGTVVDTDDLIQEMEETAESITRELGKVEGLSDEEANKLFSTIGLGALKYFILKVDPKKKMLFNPKESIDFNGHTGPFIQYTHARIRSVLRKAGEFDRKNTHIQINELEKELVKMLYEYRDTILDSAKEMNPALVANYAYELAKSYNQFYHDIQILKEENADLKNFRLALSEKVADTIKESMHLLGISVPDRM